MRHSFLSVVALLSLAWTTCPAAPADDSPRQRTRIDAGWKFSLGDPAHAEAPDFDDAAWKPVVLPHDWSIAGPFDAKATMGGAGGFLPSGIGWYRLPLDVPAAWTGKRVAVEFEGVYEFADVWLNGQPLASHPYGYTGFVIDLTPALKPGGKNVLAVRVDNSKQKNSRWYAGSGIYRHVWLTVAEPLHVAPWGVFVSVPQADAQAATVAVKTTVVNETAAPQSATVETAILAPDGSEAGRTQAACDLAPGEKKEVSQQVALKNPALWSPEKPQMSRAVTRVLAGGKETDRIETPFGVRTLAWSADKGFLLNGVALKLNGGCIHADEGVLGTAAFDRAEERKVELLKAAGFNELRTAHHPPSPALLDACDRQGMLVMEEAFDCWFAGKNSQDYHIVFKDWWERDLDAMVRRDRNHPSVVMWSIGNEIPGVMSAEGAATGPKLAAKIHSLDTTRPVTNGILGWPHDDKPDEYANAEANWNSQDIVGTNYALGRHIKQHDKYPDRMIVGTESSPGNPVNAWRDVTKNSYVVGDNVWSAQDYLGECGVGRWFYAGDPTEVVDPPKGPDDKTVHPIGHGDDRLYPWHGANPGDLDILGNSKPMAHLRNIVWDKGEKLYMAVRQPEDADHKVVVAGWGWFPVWDSWTWPGYEGKEMVVEVYSRYPSVRLYLNGKPAGEAKTGEPEGFRNKIALPYQPGELKVVGLEDGKESGGYTLATTGEPASLRLTPDRAAIHADGQDLSYVQVEALDKDGKLQPNADAVVTFQLGGPATLAGLGNADLKDGTPYQGTSCRLFHGRAQVVIRSGTQPGAAELQAAAPGLAGATARVALQ